MINEGDTLERISMLNAIEAMDKTIGEQSVESVMGVLTMEEIVKANAKATSEIPYVSKGRKPFHVPFADDHFKAEYKVEYTGGVLPMHLVKAAMIDELS